MTATTERYYVSGHYPLPADSGETKRLNEQHQLIVKAYENRLVIAPLSLKNGDRVLESAAGSGVWALDFCGQTKENGFTLEIDCIDISDRQFPLEHPPNVHFSVASVTNLPLEWTATFSYIHQRLLVAAMNDSLWRQAVEELFRVLAPGGWAELVEAEAKYPTFGIGPFSKKLEALSLVMYGAKGIIGDLDAFLPPILEKVGFVDIQLETRQIPIGAKGKNTYRGELWAEMWRGMKKHVLDGGGYGIVGTAEDFEEILEKSVQEWDTSNEAYVTYYTILARKP